MGLWERFDRRWDAAERAWFDRRARKPLAPVVVRDEVRLPHPAAAVWDLLTEPAREHDLAGPAHVRGFTVPGTPVGAVGERQCAVVRRADGAWVGMLSETEERVEGSRLVLRSLSSPTSHRETIELTANGDVACILRWEVAAEGRGGSAATLRDDVAQQLHRQLARVAVAMVGRPATEPWTARHLCCATDPLEDIDVTVGLSMPALPDAAWRVVSDADRFALDSSNPGATSFTVPGTPKAEAGEIVCFVRGPVGPGVMAMFWQVVGVEPGRSVVARSLSTDPMHVMEREVAVEPDGDGVRVTFRVHVRVHGSDARRERRRLLEVGEDYLERVRAELAA